MRTSPHFLELVEIGDKRVGLDDVSPGRAGCLEATVEILECLFHMSTHIALTDTIAVDIAGQLASGVDHSLPVPLTVTTWE